VGVPGELEIDAELVRQIDALGLMREEDTRARRVATVERLLQIGAVPVTESVGRALGGRAIITIRSPAFVVSSSPQPPR